MIENILKKEYNDNLMDRLKDKIIDVILDKEVCFKEEDGEESPSQKRHGKIDVIYKNRKVINTRYGQTPFVSRIQVFFNCYENNKSILTIDMYNFETTCLFKKFTIRSSQNSYSISDMKDIVDGIKDILDGDSNEKLISLIEYIRNYDKDDVPLIFDEVAQ